MAAPVAAPGGLRASPVGLALAAAVASGAMVALQQRINGELNLAVGNAVVTAFVSFLTGLLVVVAVVLARPAARHALAAIHDVPWWSRLGGLGGATLVAVGAAATPRIGVALLTVGLVAGQTSGGLAVDKVGLGPGGARPLTLPRLAGAALCLVAVAVSAAGEGARAASPLLLLLVVVAGFVIATQQALNGRVRAVTGDAGVATLVNFLVGTAALGLGLVLSAAVSSLDVGRWPGAGDWYLYLGGPMGAAFVAMAAIVVRRLGVLRLGLAVTAGQLAGALVLDLVLPVSDAPIGVLTVLGVALTFVAVIVSGRAAART